MNEPQLNHNQNLKQKKKLGQVFLHDRNIIDKTVRYVLEKNPAPQAIVEIGCGQGILTKALAEITPHLYVIELDTEFLEWTKKTLADHAAITWFESDILKFDFNRISAPTFTIVANIPYYISAAIIERITEIRPRVDHAFLMVQKEFADKLVANAGDSNYTSLTVFTHLYFHIHRCFKVSKTCFKPVPKVDSAVIQLTPIHPFPEYPPILFDITKAAFWGKRKTLHNCLTKSPYLQLPDAVLTKISILKTHPKIRGSELTPEQFTKLAQEIHHAHQGPVQ